MRPKVPTRIRPRQAGFTELEFGMLIAGAVAILGILSHFLFSQSIQVEKLNALVSRDSVRLTVESTLLNPRVLMNSARLANPDLPDSKVTQACLLGTESRKKECKGSTCCRSHEKTEIPLFRPGNDGEHSESDPISGTKLTPSCLDPKGNPIAGGSSDPITGGSSDPCFASCWSSLEFICPLGSPSCQRAGIVILTYRLRFSSPFLKEQSTLNQIERSLPISLE